MLDDLRVIHERDTQDALGKVERQWRQLQEQYDVQPGYELSTITSVIYYGGGHALLPGLMAERWPGFQIPFQVATDGLLPGHLDNTTLLLVMNFGEQEAGLLQVLQLAEQKAAKIVICTIKGSISDWADGKNYPVILLAYNLEPRTATLYGYKALMSYLDELGMSDKAALKLESSAKFLDNAAQSWAAVMPRARNHAKQLALELLGRSVVTYAGPQLSPAARSWKMSLNDYAKQLAWWGVYPDAAASEASGWTKQPVDKPYAVIDLHSADDSPAVQTCFRLSERLLSGLRPYPNVIEVAGQDQLEQLLWSYVLGGFVGVYCAILAGLNPSDSSVADSFKRAIGESI